ncbi:MAG: hypothetical protein Q9183_006663 [Haloplaca sp. 2 TL-2023]
MERYRSFRERTGYEYENIFNYNKKIYVYTCPDTASNEDPPRDLYTPVGLPGMRLLLRFPTWHIVVQAPPVYLSSAVKVFTASMQRITEVLESSPSNPEKTGSQADVKEKDMMDYYTEQVSHLAKKVEKCRQDLGVLNGVNCNEFVVSYDWDGSLRSKGCILDTENTNLVLDRVR